MEKQEIEKRINKAIANFKKKDKVLLKIEVNERTITHKLAEYIQKEFPDWNVDCEYNRFKDQEGIFIRNKDLPKKILIPDDLNYEKVSIYDDEATTVFPDIIIHHRREQDNLLVIEVKKSSNLYKADFDRRKLIGYINYPTLRYKFGLFIVFYVAADYKKDPELEWFPKD
ncbi:MAG: hypothetical protein ACTSRG_26565 [Candidatus Helarchaeota archaeon]